MIVGFAIAVVMAVIMVVVVMMVLAHGPTVTHRLT